MLDVGMDGGAIPTLGQECGLAGEEAGERVEKVRRVDQVDQVGYRFEVEVGLIG